MNNSWNAVSLSRELKNKPLRVYFKSTPVVLFRNNHQVYALRDKCPHRGTPLSNGEVNQGEITCPYHGWKFNGDGELLKLPGSCNFKHSNTPLIETFQCNETSGIIFLKQQDTDDLSKPFIPSFHDNYSQFSISTYLKANIIDIFENFLDPLHTHFVHSNIIRSKKQKRHFCHVEIKNIEGGYQASYIEEKRQSGLFSSLFGKHIIKSIGRVRNQNVIEIEYYSKDELELSVVIYANQETENKCKLLIRTYLKKQKTPFYVSAPIIFIFQLITFIQDKKILELVHKNNSDTFEPVITHNDIMRPYIEKAISNDVSETKKETKIML